MRIERVETLCLSRMHEPERQWVTARYRTVKADCAIVKVTCDDGSVGLGEASAYGWPMKIASWVDYLAPELIGRDPADPTLVWFPNGRDRSYDAAIAGLDIACWDLRAQAAGLPLAKLLKPDAPDQVRLYASSGCRYDWRSDPGQLVRETLGHIADGYTAVKFRMGTDWEWDQITVDRFLGLAREVAEEVGGRAELMVDGNCRLNLDQALTIARELDRLGYVWFEEPIPKEQLAGYVELRQAVGMAITGGESWTTLEQFRPFLEAGAYDIIQHDIGLCGLTEAMRIVAVAERTGVDVCPHSWHNGLMCVGHAHYVAALPRPRVVELCLIQGPLQWAILADPPVIEAGWLKLPERPGLGVSLAADLPERFPYLDGHYAVQVTR